MKNPVSCEHIVKGRLSILAVKSIHFRDKGRHLAANEYTEATLRRLDANVLNLD
jgi:hypothetical protein